MSVYITDLAAYLPNTPVSNDQMEEALGMINQTPSKTRRIILRNNKISRRHYAIDPKTGKQTHTNAQLTAEAVRKLRPYDSFSPDDIECLCCGTSSPDQIMPGHGPMVHGELGNAPCEVVSTAGICLCGMTAFKYAYMNVALGITQNAVATGSELASSFLQSKLCAENTPAKDIDLEKQPILAFDADFLRWMLSDGAGAAFLTSAAPKEGQRAFKVDWIEHYSFANELETCMYAGAVKNEDGSLTGWREFSSASDAHNGNAFLIKEDTKLLNEEIVRTAVERTLGRIIPKHNLSADQIDWFLPHYSSDFFRLKLHNDMQGIGFDIPLARWFTNLTTKGNTGSASIYIILEELFRSDKLSEGDKVLCFVPESGRFSIAYMMLTVV